jgi:hypothetical protein
VGGHAVQPAPVEKLALLLGNDLATNDGPDLLAGEQGGALGARNR